MECQRRATMCGNLVTTRFLRASLMMPQISMTVTYFRLLNHSNQLLNTHSDSTFAKLRNKATNDVWMLADYGGVREYEFKFSGKTFSLSSCVRWRVWRVAVLVLHLPSLSHSPALTRFIKRNGIIFMRFYGLHSLSCFFHIFIQQSHVPILVCRWRCCRGCTPVTAAARQIRQPTAVANVPSTQSLPQKAVRLKKIHKFFSPIFVQFVLGEKKRLQLNLNCMFCRFFCRPQTWQRLVVAVKARVVLFEVFKIVRMVYVESHDCFYFLVTIFQQIC